MTNSTYQLQRKRWGKNKEEISKNFRKVHCPKKGAKRG